MNIKLWIIYKDGIVISKFIAEMLQDRLENYMDVSVGTASKISPLFLLEEKLDYLIIGDTISETIPSVEIQNWVLKYGEISENNNLSLKVLSGFYIAFTDIENDKLWGEFLQGNINAEIIYPPILYLRLNGLEIAQEIDVFEIVKVYSNDFIEFIIK